MIESPASPFMSPIEHLPRARSRWSGSRTAVVLVPRPSPGLTPSPHPARTRTVGDGSVTKGGPGMRIESSVLSLSWIPSEAVTGLPKQVFEVGVTHYDDPPPDVIVGDDELEALREAGRFRFANRLTAWIDVHDGQVVDAGYGGGGRMGLTTVSVARKSAMFEPVALPDLQREPEIRGTEVALRADDRRARAAPGAAPREAPAVLPAEAAGRLDDARAHDPRPTARPTSRSSARASSRGTGSSTPRASWRPRPASPTSRTGTAARPVCTRPGATRTPRPSSPPSRPRSSASSPRRSCRAARSPTIRTVKQGKSLVEQGDPGDDLFLLLDGVLQVIIDGEPIAEVGPGAIVGERAILEGGSRTGTLHALTKCRVAVARGRPGRPRRARGAQRGSPARDGLKPPPKRGPSTEAGTEPGRRAPPASVAACEDATAAGRARGRGAARRRRDAGADRARPRPGPSSQSANRRRALPRLR